jgi:hypothetical protein
MKPAARLVVLLLAVSASSVAARDAAGADAAKSEATDSQGAASEAAASEAAPIGSERWLDGSDTAFDRGEADAALRAGAEEDLEEAEERPEHPLAFAPSEDVWLVPSLSYRLRYYHREGNDFAPGQVRDLLRHRARVGVEARYRELVGAFVQLQDARTFGEELDPTSDYQADGFDLHQAYARLTPGDWDLRIGRQEILLLNQRLVGNLDFAEPARAFDGFHAALSRDDARVDLAWALIRDTSAAEQATPALGGKRHLGLLHVGHQGLRGLQPHVVGLVEGDTVSELVRVTAGALIEGKLGQGVRFDYGAEGYYQWAKDGAGMRTHAYLFALRTRAVAEVPSEPSLQLHVTWVSGDADPDDAVVRTFTSPYPTGHAFHGEMDVFTDFVRDTGERGLRDAGLTLGWTPIFTTWSVALHFFDAAVYRPDDLRNHFGWEMDFKAQVPVYAPYFTMDAVYAFFNPGELMSERSADPQLEHFGYVTATTAF